MFRLIFISTALALMNVIFFSQAFSASDSSEDSNEVTRMNVNIENARLLSSEGRHSEAIEYLLNDIEEDDTNADVYNMLGFSYRKIDQNKIAMMYYKKALTIDPEHRGAHEYIGELYLKLADIDSAHKHLHRLNTLCFFGCEEFDELKEAIENYKNNYSNN